MAVVALAASIAFGCGGDSREVADIGDSFADSEFTVSTTGFRDGGRIPGRYTCDGDDRSPPITWSDVPDGVETLALVLDDPDAPNGTFKHWMIFNILPEQDGLPERVDTAQQVAGGALQLANDLGGRGYSGPCPPIGSEHRYQLFLYALDARLDLTARASQTELLNAIAEHAVARAQVSAVYSR